MHNTMETWGAELYGDPCRDCGFDWQTSTQDAIEIVRELPSGFTHLLKHHTGFERHPDLSWNASAYVSHVSDNLRIWAERLAGARISRAYEVPAYDQDLLAQARHYNDIVLSAALWSLTDAVDAWVDSVTLAIPLKVTLVHATRGKQTIQDIARNNAHDGVHHAWDVQRILNHSSD